MSSPRVMTACTHVVQVHSIRLSKRLQQFAQFLWRANTVTQAAAVYVLNHGKTDSF
jgi:hypothetical protein